jgi:hypothetical protein
MIFVESTQHTGSLCPPLCIDASIGHEAPCMFLGKAFEQWHASGRIVSRFVLQVTKGNTIRGDLLWREYELRANVKRFSRHSEDVHDAQ